MDEPALPISEYISFAQLRKRRDVLLGAAWPEQPIRHL